MAYVTPDKFSPYPRVCDICGRLDSINTMRELDGQTWVCERHEGERTAIMLDTLNAHARPPQTWPNKDPKPQNPLYPNTLEADEAALFNFIDQQIQNRTRYENVIAGDGSPLGGEIVSTMAWSARYLYDLIVQNTRPQRFIVRGKALLAQAADYIYSRQRGFGLVPAAARATDAFWGGVLEPGSTEYITADTAAGGLALLYAYRVLGTGSYLAGARGAANYVRNVQAIGSHGAQFTASNAAGTARLYTGAVASAVSTTFGVDPGQIFYSNHLFYPSGLLALEFWDELEATDGDQSIGSTGTGGDAFVSSPAQLMSLSMEQMRACWETGITDSTATLINGLSTTTPREVFNAYPAAKLGFSNIIGTGRWEFQDGNAAVGTTVSAQNFAIALGSLFVFEGQSTQVAAVSDWLRTFTSNADYETAAVISPADLARETTGDYDPTICPSTLLLVRDADNSYASIKLNGSSLYDWGAFGALSQLWAARYATSFKNARINALNIDQRFDDGTPSDGLYFDRIELRGLSGLSFQTAFGADISQGSTPGTSFPAGQTIVSSTPPTEGLIFWVKGDAGLVSSGGNVVSWADQSGQAQNLNAMSATAPTTGTVTIDSIPSVTFPTGNDSIYASRGSALHDRNGVAIPYTSARTIMAVMKPVTGDAGITGGPVFASADQPNFEALLDVEVWGAHSYALFVFANLWRLGGDQLLGPDTIVTDWNGIPTMAEWRSSGYPNIAFAVNGYGDRPLTDASGVSTSSQSGQVANPAGNVFAVGNCWNNGGGFITANFHGSIAEVLVWDYELTGAARRQAIGYLANRYPSVDILAPTIGMTNDAIRAAQYGRSFREAH